MTTTPSGQVATPPTPGAPATLQAADTHFMQAGVSLVVGACSDDRMPVVARATGCRISRDQSEVTVLMSATQGAEVLRCVRQNGAVAVVFSKPSTHKTIQLKGRDARVAGPMEGDHALALRYGELFSAELAPLGFDPALIRTLLACPPADLVTVTFTPAEAYIQTPGPSAGQRIGSAA
jgi:hypothetical protein